MNSLHTSITHTIMAIINDATITIRDDFTTWLRVGHEVL